MTTNARESETEHVGQSRPLLIRHVLPGKHVRLCRVRICHGMPSVKHHPTLLYRMLQPDPQQDALSLDTASIELWNFNDECLELGAIFKISKKNGYT